MKIAKLEEEFANPDIMLNIQESNKKKSDYDEYRRQLNERMDEWEEMNRKLEELVNDNL